MPGVLTAAFASSMKSTFPKKLAFVIVALAAIGLIFHFSGGISREYQSQEFLMDTLVTIRVYGSDTEQMKLAVTEAFREMRRIQALTDRYAQPGTAAFLESDICRINAAAGVGPVQVEEDVFTLLQLAKEYNEITGGMFEITIGPVIDAWGFGSGEPSVPSGRQLEQALALVGSKDLILNRTEQTAFLSKKGMSLDLGAIAKGYATEKAADVLAKYGIKEAIIDAGGNVKVIGKKEGKLPWKVGVQDPRDSGNLVAVLSLIDEAAVTSGDYNRFFVFEGKRYHHLLSPRTGFPAEENMSVTVVARDATLADILSTALFMLDQERALELLGRIEGAEALIIGAEGRILTSKGLQDKIQVSPGEVYSYDQG